MKKVISMNYERGCSWIIKFSYCLDFGYHKHGIIKKKKIFEVNNF